MKMKFIAVTGCVAAMLAGAALNPAQDPDMPQMPEMPKPTSEHAWLKQLEGEWTYEAEITMEPGQPAMKSTGTETVRTVGGFWVVSENKGEFFGSPFTGILTIGFSAEKGKYIGTWVDSMSDYLWTYEGTVDSTGRKLTLTTEGPCPEEPGATRNFRETIEIKGSDHKVFSSAIQDDDGTWNTMLTINYQRKK